jgi:cytochrome P450
MTSFADYRDIQPYDFYETVRESKSPVWDSGMNAWLVVSHQGCRRIQFEEETNFVPLWQEVPPETLRTVRGSERSHTAAKGEQHKRQHLHLVRTLMPSNLSRVLGIDLTDIVAEATRKELAGLLRDGGGDLTEGWLDRLPMTLFLRLLDLRFDDAEREEAWQNIRSLHRLNEFFDRDAAVMQEATAAAEAWNARLLPVIRERQSAHNRGNDLISYLWATGPDVLPEWNERDVLAACRGLFGAGTMTTYHLLCNLVWLLVADGDLQERVRADPGTMLPQYIEEALRLEPPVHYRPRYAVKDTDFDGVRIRQGEEILVVLAAANRDPAVHHRPADMILERNSPTTLHSFYRGRRACAGANLARSETEEILSILLSKARVSLTGEPPNLRGHMFRAYRPLMAKLEPVG